VDRADPTRPLILMRSPICVQIRERPLDSLSKGTTIRVSDADLPSGIRLGLGDVIVVREGGACEHSWLAEVVEAGSVATKGSYDLAVLGVTDADQWVQHNRDARWSALPTVRPHEATSGPAVAETPDHARQ
jgi:hypothetical protein